MTASQDALRLRARRPGQLDAIIRTVKTIDAVYDAYAVMRGGTALSRG